MNKIKYLILFVFVLIPTILVWGQRGGKLEIIADSRIPDLVDLHILFNEKSQTVPGFRIIIASLSGNYSKSSAFKMKNTFLSNHENTQVYISFEEPNFKVKVGDFRTKLEAFCFFQKIKATYPNAYIIKDNVYTFKLKSGDTIENEDDEDIIEEK